MLKQSVTNRENFGKAEFCSALSVCLNACDSETKKKNYEATVKTMQFDSPKRLKMFIKSLTGFGNLSRELQTNLETLFIFARA